MKGPEAIVESGVNVDYVDKELAGKVWRIKLRLIGSSGWPDQVYLAWPMRILFVEYKAPGEEPRPKQVEKHDILRRLGFHVETIDSTQKGRALLRAFAEEEGAFSRQITISKAEAKEICLLVEDSPVLLGKKIGRLHKRLKKELGTDAT